MSGRPLPIGDDIPWTGGTVTSELECLLAPNPSPWTLEGTNTWLIREGSGLVVIDPGPDDEGHLQRIAQAGDVREILLTHGHIDHAAGALQLRSITGAPVRALDPEHVHGGEGLHGGDTVSIGDDALHVISTPGHSSDSLCFRFRDHVITGDTVLGRGTTVIAWPDGNLGEYLASLEALAEIIDALGVTTLLPGHGPVVAEAAQRIEWYREHREQRLDEVIAAMADGHTDAEAIVDAVYANVDPGVRNAALLSVRAQLDYLKQ